MSGDHLSFLLSDLAQRIGAELVGDPHYRVSSIATLQAATLSDLSFIANPAYVKYLATTKAGALIVDSELAPLFPGNKLISHNPYLCYARISELFNRTFLPVVGIHPSAVIGQGCTLGKNISIGANAVVADGVTLGDGVVIGAGSCIGNDSCVGARSRLHANVTLYPAITIGSDCIIHSGAVIGADGFGFSPSPEGWVKIHQLGSVIVGNRVEIGANTTIDRGALDNTIIEDGVIIDNLVQIGHNVRLGKNTAIAAHTAIAGSTSIGNNCTIAGAVAIAGHVILADKVHISGMSMVSSSIDEAGSYSSGIPLSPTKVWRRNAARFRQLDNLAVRLIKIERSQKDE